MHINPCFPRFFIKFLRQYCMFNEYWTNLSLQVIYIIRILQFEIDFATHVHIVRFLNSLIISSQIQLFSRFCSQHSDLYLSVNLFVNSFLHSGFIVASWPVYLSFIIFADNLCRLSIMLPFFCHILIYMLWWNCSPVDTGRFLILYFVRV